MGMSRGLKILHLVLMFVPLAGIYPNVFLCSAPTGFMQHRKYDTGGKVIGAVLVTLYLGIWIASVAINVAMVHSTPPLAATPVPVPNPAPLAPAPVVIEEPKPAPLKSDLQNVRPDASLPKANTTYRVSGVTENDFLNMRQGPGISYPAIQRLQNGVDGVTLIGGPVNVGRIKWQKINSRGVVGWVNADYLTPSYDGQNTQDTVTPNARGR